MSSNSQEKQGSAPGSKQGSAPGSKPGSAPGSKPGSAPGSKPGSPPGSDPGSKPGSAPESAPGSKPGSGHGGTPVPGTPGVKTPTGSLPDTPHGSTDKMDSFVLGTVKSTSSLGAKSVSSHGVRSSPSSGSRVSRGSSHGHKGSTRMSKTGSTRETYGSDSESSVDSADTETYDQRSGIASFDTLEDFGSLLDSSSEMGSRTRQGKLEEPQVKIIDSETGEDVTPLPLYGEGSRTSLTGDAKQAAEGAKGDAAQTTTLYQNTTQLFQTFTTYSGFPLFVCQLDDDEEVERAPMAPLAGYLDTGGSYLEVPETPDDMVAIKLKETATIWMLSIEGICVDSTSEEAEIVLKKNKEYDDLCKLHQESENYVGKGMMTLVNKPKAKGMQADGIRVQNQYTIANAWDRYDMYEAAASQTQLEAESSDFLGALKVPERNLNKEEDGDEEVGGGGETTSVILNLDTSNSQPMMDQEKSKEMCVKEALCTHAVVILERILTQNLYQPKQALYRGLTSLVQSGDMTIPLGPHLQRLWAFASPITKGKAVTCMAWNPHNKDLFAIGYGSLRFQSVKTGLACVWSVKNAEVPEKMYTFSKGVTSISFSDHEPNLLGVGCMDGNIYLVNVSEPGLLPFCDSTQTSERHQGAVWQVKWKISEVGEGRQKKEVLFSIAEDGKVCQWLIRKGLEPITIMKLKRMPTRAAGREKKADVLVSQLSVGYCFDFHRTDNSVYLAGTDEGHIHKCSTAYSEQYLFTYLGHNGPVYRVTWSPVLDDIFISCGGDWTVKIWQDERPACLLSFCSSLKTFFDVCWCPYDSTVFACVNDSDIEVWDLSHNILEPAIVYTPISNTTLSSICFAHNSHSVLVGDQDGQVTVYTVKCLMPKSEDPMTSLRNALKTERDKDDETGDIIP